MQSSVSYSFISRESFFWSRDNLLHLICVIYFEKTRIIVLAIAYFVKFIAKNR